MRNDSGLGRVRFASNWLRTEEHVGRIYGEELLSLPTGKWRSTMIRDENLRRYGTLRYVLDAIHEGLYETPIQSRERAAIVVEFTECAEVPDEHYRRFLVGVALREYARTLRVAGEFPVALELVRRARSTLGAVGSLASEAAIAHLIEALILREMGDLDATLEIAIACEKTFSEYGESTPFMHARMTRCLVLSDSKRYREAMALLVETAKTAEASGDRRTLAICLHNTAECARAIGELAEARDLDARALVIFRELGTSIEIPSIRWTEGLALADEGKVSAAILQLRITRSEFLGLGMNGSAVDVGLDVVRLKFQLSEDVTAECIELIETFTHAGMIQPAIEALAYLREQSHRGTVCMKKITYVQTFVREVVKGPSRLFVPPREGEAC